MNEWKMSILGEEEEEKCATADINYIGFPFILSSSSIFRSVIV